MILASFVAELFVDLLGLCWFLIKNNLVIFEGSGVGVAASGNRRMASAKDPAKSTEKAKDKIKSSSKSSSSSVSSGSRGSSAHSRRAKEPGKKKRLLLLRAVREKIKRKRTTYDSTTDFCLLSSLSQSSCTKRTLRCKKIAYIA